MLDELQPDELQAALAVVQNMRAAKANAATEKALIEAGDWSAIEQYAHANQLIMSDEPIAPWKNYKHWTHGPSFWQIRIFQHWKEPHDLQPVLMLTSKRMMRERSRRAGNSSLQYGQSVFERWARMTKLTALTYDDFRRECRGYDWEGRRFGSNKHEIGTPPWIGNDDCAVWMRGKYVYLSREQYERIKAMSDIIAKTRDLDRRVQMMQAWKRERGL